MFYVTCFIFLLWMGVVVLTRPQSDYVDDQIAMNRAKLDRIR